MNSAYATAELNATISLSYLRLTHCFSLCIVFISVLRLYFVFLKILFPFSFFSSRLFSSFFGSSHGLFYFEPTPASAYFSSLGPFFDIFDDEGKTEWADDLWRLKGE